MQHSSAAKNLSPRQLALVITELEPGGAERCLVELAIRLDRSRFSPIVYSLAPPPGEKKQGLLVRLAASQIPIHYLGVTRSWQYVKAVQRLAQMLRDQRMEIVQTFLFHANIVGARAAKAAGVPHVITGIRVADPRWWRTTIERWATASASRVVCVSQSVAEFCRHRGFAADKLIVIPNGIDLQTWQAAQPVDVRQWGVPRGRRLLLYVGRLDRQKGLDRFFSELPVVFRELPDHDLLLVGEGKLDGELHRRAAQSEISPRVHFANWQDNVPAIMAAADILVLPSRWEGMPNVVLEAMAAGKPVIATQAEGTVELLGLGALEQTVPVGDWAGFRSRLISVLNNPSLAVNLGRQNQGRAQQFSLEFVANRYERLYEALAR